MKQIAIAGALATFLIVGCGQDPVVHDSTGQRAQRMAVDVSAEPNGFVGIWASPPSNLVNDWIVVFTPNGFVAVDGPGMKADGTYTAEGNIAKSAYDKRDSAPIKDPGDNTVFKLTADGRTLVFATGDPLDPPVKLVRSSDPRSSMERPSLKKTADPDVPVDPFTLAQLAWPIR